MGVLQLQIRKRQLMLITGFGPENDHVTKCLATDDPFVLVPSMMPRPILLDAFNLTYRKIPVCIIGRDVECSGTCMSKFKPHSILLFAHPPNHLQRKPAQLYCDTSIIIEALEQLFASPHHPTIYPLAADGRSNRALIRGFASYWTDRPFFRVTTGLVPAAVWRTSFGTDRAGLIGHELDPEKLAAKIPKNLAALDLHLSILEPQLGETDPKLPWIFSTASPSLADISLYYQLSWGRDISRGALVRDLTGGGSPDLNLEGMKSVFNEDRYPAIWAWYHNVEKYFNGLASTETARIERADQSGWQAILDKLAEYSQVGDVVPTITTPVQWNKALDGQSGLKIGASVSVAPDDTGSGDPVMGTVVALSSEEVVIAPAEIQGKNVVKTKVDVRIHFPRLGFVIRPIKEARL